MGKLLFCEFNTKINKDYINQNINKPVPLKTVQFVYAFKNLTADLKVDKSRQRHDFQVYLGKLFRTKPSEILYFQYN